MHTNKCLSNDSSDKQHDVKMAHPRQLTTRTELRDVARLESKVDVHQTSFWAMTPISIRLLSLLWWTCTALAVNFAGWRPMHMCRSHVRA